jgi:hypothetical protein
MRRSLGLVLGCALLLGGWRVAADTEAADLSKVDLSGNWYVLIHYKDDDSVDKSITKFKDLVWTIEQKSDSMSFEEYPYVMFSENQELLRRHSMIQHLPWEPDDSTWERIREEIGVSARAMKTKNLSGSVADGYSSSAGQKTGGFTTMTFETTWRVRFAPDKIRVEIVDVLGGAGLEGMEGATVYEVRERRGADELRGRFDRDTLHGTFRMVRSKDRKVVK